MILGGSTNAVLHLIAMAHSVGIKLDIDDFQNVSDRIPFLADIKPSGKYVMEDVYKLGGIPSTTNFFSISMALVFKMKKKSLQKSWRSCSRINLLMGTT